MEKILITTGGTGGHVIPAKIIGDHLSDDFDIIFSTDLRGYKYLESSKKIVIDTPKLNLNLLIPARIIKLFFLIIKSILYLKKNQINKVISTGGYMSLPVCLAAKFLRLKIYLLEPNLVLGRSNKYFLRLSEKIICYSDHIKNFPKTFINKIRLIKPLVSKEFHNFKKTENINEKFCFLIVGGSQGAKFFDEFIKDSFVDLSKKYSIKVIHQTSSNNIENLNKFYNKNNLENKIFDFEKNFVNLINMADLCITRAGATSLAEISIMNKPFLAIPLPTSKDNHQMENAKFYEKNECCWILDQKSMNKKNFINLLSGILDDKSEYINKKKNLKKLNNQNSWNDVNQKLKKIINEN